ncbi:50S ribosomal protein L34e [Candidatus Woesearchaeota archaeon]|nr:50S ribosomal protein L34e [Candidatus Woesearchaeota archaeon]
MPAGKHKSGRYRKIFVRTPGSRTVIHYRERKPSRAKCALCKGILAGVPREMSSTMRNISKSAKKPERPYGGYLCSACTKQLLIEKARGRK